MRFATLAIVAAVAGQASATRTIPFSVAISAFSSASSSVSKLLSVVYAFPTTHIAEGSGLASALSIAASASSLATALTNGANTANSVSPTPVASSNVASVLSVLSSFKPQVTSALYRIIFLKSQFSSLGVTSIVSAELSTLFSDAKLVETALLADVSPGAQSNSGAAIASTLNAVFSSAIAAYP